MLDQAESLRQLAQAKEGDVGKTKIITVTSGKGGVGKSNFVVNLGISLQMKNKKVLIFDADIGMGNDDVLMGVYPRYNVFDVIKGMKIEDIIVEGPFGISLLAAGSGVNQVEDLNSEQRNLFLSKLEELSGYDYILMDTGAGINRSVLAFIACSEELIILTTPEPTSLTDAYSLIKASDSFKIKDSAYIVVNKAFDSKEGIETFDRFKSVVDKFLSVKVTYLGCILEDRSLVKSVKNQVPVIIGYPKSDVSRSIEKISEALISRNVESKNVFGAKELFKKLFNIFS